MVSHCTSDGVRLLWFKSFELNKIINKLGGNEEDLQFFCDNLDLQVDGKKVPRDAAHPHFPFNIPY